MILIARWSHGNILMGETAFYLALLKNGNYAVSEASAMALNFYERLATFTNIVDAVEFFGKCCRRIQ